MAADRVLVGVVGEEVAAVRDRADRAPRLRLGMVEQRRASLAEDIDAEALDHLAHLALARVHAGDLGVHVAPVLLGHAHVGEKDVAHVAVELAPAVELHGRQPHALLVHLGQRARERRRHRAAHVGVVDMGDREAGDLALVEDRLPDMHVRRVRAHEARVGIVGDRDVAFLVAVDEPQRAAVVEADEPGDAQLVGRGEGLAVGIGEAGGEVLRLLDEGRVRGAQERARHALRRGGAVVGEDLQRHLVDGHGALLVPLSGAL